MYKKLCADAFAYLVEIPAQQSNARISKQVNSRRAIPSDSSASRRIAVLLFFFASTQ